ncbi:uncharacterized protein TNCV_1609271 [Trichonephila clavipes]|nr:uncharacterized protein TNCV_1609271 [Trichonephila clavipes]
MDSVFVQELLDSHNQELTIDELIEMHERERDIEELEPLEPVQCEDRMTFRKLTEENSLAVLNHKILEANSQVQNVKLGGHQTCLSINRLWHEPCDMLRRLVGTTAPGHHDFSIQE